MQEKGKFESTRRYCPQCGKIIPRSHKGDLCPACEDYEQYRKVKDYISTHSVTAKEVSEIFNIPMSKVKGWINEGYIQYRGGVNWK